MSDINDLNSKLRVNNGKKTYPLPKKYILFLGNVESRKNIIGLIEAFELSQQYNLSSYHLIIAGADGYGAKRIKDRANVSPCKDKIRFLDYIPPQDKPALYANASLFVFPSFYEGFGFPVLEAISAGAPVICSNRSSLPEVVGDAAYLVNPNNSADIMEGIARLAQNDKLRAMFAQKGLERAKKFSWQKSAEQWLENIEQMDANSDMFKSV